MIDSHCHLDVRVWGSDEEVDAVVARAHAAGVEAMVAIGSGYGFESGGRAVAVAERHAGVRASVGLHPHDAREATSERLAEMYTLARRPVVLALVEMGLDSQSAHSPWEVKRAACRDPRAVAHDPALTVIIHDLGSAAEPLA